MSFPLYYIRCRISRGGFASERRFSIRDVDGQEIAGISDIEYLRDEQGNGLSEDEPPEGQSIDGFVACRIIRKVKDQVVLIEIPSSDLARVEDSVLADNRGCVMA